MRGLALHLCKESDYDALISGSQSLLPPPGASEVDVKVWQVHFCPAVKHHSNGLISSQSLQLHLDILLLLVLVIFFYMHSAFKVFRDALSQLHSLLESTECDMIRAVQRRINTELALVLSERSRQDTGLPTGTQILHRI